MATMSATAFEQDADVTVPVASEGCVTGTRSPRRAVRTVLGWLLL